MQDLRPKTSYKTQDLLHAIPARYPTELHLQGNYGRVNSSIDSWWNSGQPINQQLSNRYNSVIDSLAIRYVLNTSL